MIFVNHITHWKLTRQMEALTWKDLLTLMKFHRNWRIFNDYFMQEKRKAAVAKQVQCRPTNKGIISPKFMRLVRKVMGENSWLDQPKLRHLGFGDFHGTRPNLPLNAINFTEFRHDEAWIIITFYWARAMFSELQRHDNRVINLVPDIKLLEHPHSFKCNISESRRNFDVWGMPLLKAVEPHYIDAVKTIPKLPG